MLIGLLALATLGFLVTPLLDTGPMVFFGLMFGLSVVLAGSDVAIDRATVIAGDEEAKATGRSRATTVGLNQAICWLAIYGSSTLAAALGGYATDHVPFKGLLVALAGVPLLVLLFVLRLPRDTAVPTPVGRGPDTPRRPARSYRSRRHIALYASGRRRVSRPAPCPRRQRRAPAPGAFPLVRRLVFRSWAVGNPARCPRRLESPPAEFP